MEMTAKKKLGGLGKLSQFSGIKAPEPEPIIVPLPPTVPQEAATPKLVSINIKITKSQKDWLATTASQVRDNNSEPVPPSERVYPQHLIGVAIELLQAAEVDWSQVRNGSDLREQLNL
jgi:hypothetical protein